ncbi:glycosyltransferase family 39 protein [Nakamurella endophytica]|uniref:Glycosyl transferase n=1 Tax=Nakamurella endophytica TaxID=1748367 RepID=A0A917SP57_9ACTN|nr:glycosyltransferase family 39 protein [Nakamurella endophytica]GGL88476.1 glycosyl transferase [Nakamurella endophytica]
MPAAPALDAPLVAPPAAARPPAADPSPAPPRRRWSRLALGRPEDPRWARPALWLLLVATAALYLVDLSASGYANDFYAAAVKSGTESWKAWLFGSLDAGNSITVDKPPASLWLMVLSARILGFSSFSLLLPQALMGVGTVAVLHAAVRRWSGHAAGLVAGALVALTPVAALMFRFDNPDALLVLLMTVAAYCVVRAVEGAPSRRRPGATTALRWLVLAGTALGFAFLTKMLQGLLVPPGFGLAYLVAGRPRLGRRLLHLVAAAGALVVSAGWFVALVAVWPADSRPYIGGSTDNSLWELAIGYNGLGRILGGSGNGGGGGGGGFGGGQNVGFGGATGITRMFGTAFGTEISWLLPAALVALVAGVWFTRRASRTDRIRAALLIWGGWVVVTALVLSFMQGTVHPYYAVALAPGIAATVAVAGRELWHGRAAHLARGALALMIAATAAWSFYLLGRDAAGWLPWLRWVVLVGGMAGAALLGASVHRLQRWAVVGLLVGSIAALGATASFTVATAAQPHTGSVPTSGPAGYGSGVGGRMGGVGARPTGTPPAGATAPDGTDTGSTGSTGTAPSGRTGGFGRGGSTDGELVTLLDATTTRWSAAVIGDQSAAGYILSTDTAVMAIGGWSGSDDSPTLAQFQQYVASGQITYFVAGGGRGGGMGGQGGTSVGAQITAWVQQHYTATTVGSVTVYDLTKPAS